MTSKGRGRRRTLSVRMRMSVTNNVSFAPAMPPAPTVLRSVDLASHPSLTDVELFLSLNTFSCFGTETYNVFLVATSSSSL
jgi:hypothetical protein